MRKRNERMAGRIVELLTSEAEGNNDEKVFFFSAGVQHLLGEGKIQEALEAAGYGIQRVGGDGEGDDDEGKGSTARKSDEL